MMNGEYEIGKIWENREFEGSAHLEVTHSVDFLLDNELQENTLRVINYLEKKIIIGKAQFSVYQKR
jgi:hypothetical protein